MSETLQVSEVFSSIQGEGLLAGRRQIFVRLTGCNLDCLCCDTNFAKTDICKLESRPGSGDFIDLPQPLTLKQLTSVIADWQYLLPGAHHSISFTGGEPLLQSDSLAKWFPEIQKLIPVHLETNGTMHEALMEVIGHVDFISMDMKLPSTSGCTAQLLELHRLFLKQSLGNNVSVKIVVGEATDSLEVMQVCDIICSLNRATPLFMQPMTLSDGRTGISSTRILCLQELASSMLPDVRVIPQMHKLLGLL